MRVEIKVGDGEFNALIDGPIVAQRIEMHAQPGSSTLCLIVHDDSVLLNRDEGAELFEDMTPSDIAESLIGAAGLIADVESVPAAGGAQTRFEVRRGTAMQMLRALARRNGMFVYVKPGDTPGQSVCVFQKPALTPGDAPELLLLGQTRNISKFSVQFDALRPTAARAGNVRVSDKTLLDSETESAEVAAMGDEPLHSALPSTARSLLNGTREEQNDLDAATVAAVDMSTFALTATAELDANDYAHSLSPYEVINVAGPGGRLGGAYLVSRVQHLFNDSNYKQNVTLRRNALSAGGGGGPGLPGGIF
jgi:phage protein D